MLPSPLAGEGLGVGGLIGVDNDFQWNKKIIFEFLIGVCYNIRGD